MQIKVQKSLGSGGGSAFDLDVDVTADGGITVLAGPSGAGKTTMLRLIAGILTPDSGLISVGGRTYFDSERLIDLPIQERRVGFVFQNYALFPHLNAEQNVAYGAKAAEREARSARALDMLDAFKIGNLRDRLPHEISGGEQQRVAVARALASEPDIVLLDEPLSAVDVETRSKLLDELEAAQVRTGIPFIYVTHNQAEADRLGSHHIVLNNGRVASAGPRVRNA